MIQRLPVLSVASELYPLVKTGGLADVAGALPRALAPHGVRMRSLLPAYPQVRAKVRIHGVALDLGELFGGTARVLQAEAEDLELYLLEAPHLFDRPGGPYQGPDRADWGDNAERFAALAWAGSRIGLGDLADFRPRVVHGHDWQAGLLPAYVALDDAHQGPRPGTVTTIHNLAFQGQFPAALLAPLRLPARAFATDGLEYYGSLGFLKAGLYYADRITTVSPTYALEIQTPDGGMGMDGLLRDRAHDLVGILNGIDLDDWDPMRDPALPRPFGADDPSGKADAKAAVQRRFGLNEDPGALLAGVVSRLSHQKGMDLLESAMGAFLDDGGQLAVVGSGDAAIEHALGGATLRYPGRIGVFVGYDEPLAHLVQGGCDAIVVPSRFEPCGLTQLCALRYGTLPIVARVGGLADTVIDANPMALAAGVATGFQFQPPTATALSGAFERALHLYRDRPETWRRMRTNALSAPVGWEAAGGAYAGLYRGLGQRAKTDTPSIDDR